MATIIEEKTVARFLAVLGLFILINFNDLLGIIYGFMLLFDWLWIETDKKVSYPFENNSRDRGRNILVALATYPVFLLISLVVLNTLNFNLPTAGTAAVITLLAQTTPILQGNIFFTYVGWGFLVPLIETRFFHGRLQEGTSEFLSKRLGRRVNLSKLSDPMTWFVILFIATLFTVFHLTAKNIQSAPLMITFIFSIISSILVIKTRETFTTSVFHIVVNVIAVAASLGTLAALGVIPI